MVGTQIDGGRVSVQTHSGVEARGHVVILRLLHDLTVDTGRGGGQGDALTRLDQHRIPLVGHYDPYPVVSMAGFAAYDAGLVAAPRLAHDDRSEEHTSELQSRPHLVCRLLLEKKKKIQ